MRIRAGADPASSDLVGAIVRQSRPETRRDSARLRPSSGDDLVGGDAGQPPPLAGLLLRLDKECLDQRDDRAQVLLGLTGVREKRVPLRSGGADDRVPLRLGCVDDGEGSRLRPSLDDRPLSLGLAQPLFYLPFHLSESLSRLLVGPRPEGVGRVPRSFDDLRGVIRRDAPEAFRFDAGDSNLGGRLLARTTDGVLDLGQMLVSAPPNPGGDGAGAYGFLPCIGCDRRRRWR